MTKRQLIDEIVSMNQSAKPGFLAAFDDSDLDEYLEHLRLAQTPRLAGDPHRYDHYFDDCPAIGIAGSAPAIQDRQSDQPADEADEAPGDLDLNVCPAAYFEQSYEAKAS